MSDSEKLEVEIEQLRSSLKITGDKMKVWLQDDLGQLVSNIKQHEDNSLKKSYEEKARLKNGINTQQEEKGKALEEKLSGIQLLKSELEKQYKLTEDLKGKKAKYETKVSSLEKEAVKLKEEIESTTKDKQQLEYLSKASSIFSDMLGLSIRKTKGKRIQLIFTQIDEKDPSLTFYLFVQVVNGKYIVTDSEPPIEGLEDLVRSLNETNNLRGFVLKIRQKYKAMVKS